MRRAAKKFLLGGFLGALFLLPFFSWIAAEPVTYRDPGGFFSIEVPSGWKADDSGYMGQGVVMKGRAGPSGVEAVIQLIHEPAGIVTLDVLWHTRLGQLRYDLERVKFLSMENHEDSSPPYNQARYSYVDKERAFLALVRLVKHEGRFFYMTAAAAEEESEDLLPLFLSAFDSFRPGGGG